MATPIWTGATDEDFEKTTNWKAGVVPVTGDSVFYTQVPLNHCRVNMNQVAKNFVQVLVTRAMIKDVGSSANPLICGIDRLEFAGPASGYFTSGGDAKLIDNFAQQSGLVFLSPLGSASSLSLATVSGGQLNLLDGRILKLIVSAEINGASLVNIDDAVDLLTSLQIRNGSVISQCKFHDLLEVRGGELTLEKDAAVITGSAKMVIHDGTVRYDCSGDATNVEQYAGLVTASNNPNGDSTIQVGATAYDLWGGELDLDNGSRNIVATLRIRGKDHSCHFATGKTIAFGDI